MIPVSTVATRRRIPISEHVQPVVRFSIACLTGLVGLADMLSAVVPRIDSIAFFGIWPTIITDVFHRAHAQTLTVVVGFFLIMLSYGLARGKRHAWRITFALLLLSAFFLHTLRGGSVLASVAALLLAALLASSYRFFQARSDPPAAWRGYGALLLSIAIVFFYAVGGVIALWNDFAPFFDRLGIDGVVIRILVRAHMLHMPHQSPAFYFERAIPWLCVSALLYGMLQIFRPVAAVLLPKHEQRTQAAQITQRYGTNSISYFALSDEKSYFFSRSGKTVISYVLQASTAVVAGDPIGPEEEIFPTIKEFIQFCKEQDWTIVFWQVRDTTAQLYRKAGFRLLKIGEDAIIHTDTFTLKGGAMANVRSSAKRAEKEGLRIVFYHGRVTDSEQLAQMERISAAWIKSKGGSEMGFSMGHFNPPGDERLLYAVAINASNKVHAFVSFVPIYGRNGWGLDLMRRADLCAPGTMELLLARSIEHIKQTGYTMVSLGLAPLSNTNNEDESFLDTSIDFLTNRFGNPQKNQSLYNFKKKFNPCWESRYLVYSDAITLPKVGLALYRAHQSDASLLRTIRSSLLEWQRTLRHSEPARALDPAHA